jgi:type IV secretion system protein VirB10
VLDTAIDVTLPGLTSCTVTRNVYSANGRVLLLERGSRVDGEHGAGVRTGTKRVFILWSRITTPNGVVIDVDSPAADSLGRSGIDGEVDNHWGERVGGAFMLSLVQDGVAALASKEAGTSNAGGAVVLQNTQSAGSTLAGKVLDSTINIPATFAKNQGDRVNVFVARDLDFGGVYGLRADQ